MRYKQWKIQLAGALLLGLAGSTAVYADSAAVTEQKTKAYQELLEQFVSLSRTESPLAYIRLVAEPLLDDPSDRTFVELVNLLKPHVNEDPRTALLYAALLSAQAHKPFMPEPGKGMTPEQIRQWQALNTNPMIRQAHLLLTNLCQKQNLQACLAWFNELTDLASPTMLAGSVDEQQKVLSSLVEPENEVRRVAITNYAQQPSSSLARMIANLYEKGLMPIPPSDAKAIGFVRDDEKAAQWRKKADAPQ